MLIRLDEDWHVHSTFSDGANSLAENVAAAERLGLRHLGCVDHVRRDTTYVPDYVAAVEDARSRTAVELSIGIEAKILTADGELDLPDSCAGTDLVYVADHQYPGPDGPISPRVVREGLAAGERTPNATLRALVDATIATMERYAGVHGMVLAHLFSIVPKLGLAEEQISLGDIDRIAAAASATGTIIELSERWRCPAPAVFEACARHGVRVVASTDAHRSTDIAAWDFVKTRVE